VNHWPAAAAPAPPTSEENPGRFAVTVLHKTTSPGRRWRPGDELREVFTFTVNATSPLRASLAARALAHYLDLGCCTEHDDQASAYQAAGLRPLRVGDVLLVSGSDGDGGSRGERTPLEVVGIGFHPFAAGYIPDFTPAASPTDVVVVEITPPTEPR
jgi:hypothetical protein